MKKRSLLTAIVTASILVTIPESSLVFAEIENENEIVEELDVKEDETYLEEDMQNQEALLEELTKAEIQEWEAEAYDDIEFAEQEALVEDERLLQEELLEENAILSEENISVELPYEKTETDEEVIINMKANCTRAELQKALYEEHEGKQLIVNVPAGEYEFDGRMYIQSNTTLYSEPGTVYMRTTGYCTTLSSYNAENDIGGYDQIKNVSIIGGVFDGGGGKGQMIRFTHGSNITIQDAIFGNVSDGSHILSLEGIDGALIDGCTFEDYDMGEEPVKKEALHIDVVHNDKIAPGSDNYDDAVSQNITITNCNFENVPRGIGSHSAVKGVFPNNISIVNNTFRNIYYDAIKIFNYKDSEISYNTIEDSGNGIFIHTLLSSSNSSPTLYDPLPGTETEDFPTEAEGYNYNIIVQGNIIKNIQKHSASGYGVAVTGHADYPLGGVSILNNQIGEEDEAGNVISKGTDHLGIYLNICAMYNTVSGNEIISTEKYGIMLKMNSAYNTVESNEIHYPEEYGLYISNSDSTILHANRVVESGRSSFALTGSENCDIQENRSKNSGGGGIVAVKGSHTPVIRLNTIYNPSGNAIYVTDSDTVRIVGNTLQRIRNATGIYVQDCEALNTSYNSFTNTTKTPIKLLRVTKANTTSLELIKVNEITAGSTRVRGTAGKAGSTVTVTVNEKDYKTVVAESRTFSSYLIPAMSKGTKVVVTEKDVKGNMVKAAATVA